MSAFERTIAPRIVSYAEQGLRNGRVTLSVRLSVLSFDHGSGGFAADRHAGRGVREQIFRTNSLPFQ